MKKIIALSLVLLFLFIIVLVPSLVITSRPSSKYSNSSTYFNSLILDKTISFSFNSSDTNLNSLTFVLKNPQILNNSLINFFISNGVEERALSFSGSNIGDPSNLVLKFNSLPNINNIYSVSITSDNTTPESLFILSDMQNKPIFTSTYYQAGFNNRIKYNLSKLITQIQSLSSFYVYPYLLILLLIFILL